MSDDQTPTESHDLADAFAVTDPHGAVLVDDAPTQPSGPPPWPAPGAGAGAPPPREPRDTTRRPGGWKQFLVGALVGALVGGAVAAGVTAATDDGGNGGTVVVRSSQSGTGRNTSTIAQAEDIQGILAKVEPAVVAISASSNAGQGAGTGFVISADGIIVTNNHVVEGADDLEVTFNDGTRRAARLIGASADNDLAVLKVNATGLATAKLGSSEALQVGDEVIAIGNALDLEGGLSVTRGIISGKNRAIPEDTATIYGALQTDAAINPGNSGGPLVNADGEVVGINTAIAPPGQAQNIGFAISIDAAKTVIDDLRVGREVRTAFLGVSTSEVTSQLADRRNLETQTGVLVDEVGSGTPADDAGLEQGDVIIAVNRTAVSTPDDLGAAIRKLAPNDEVELRIERDGEQRTLTATLGTRPANG